MWTGFLEAHAPRDRARVLHINFSRAPVWEIEKFFETRHSWIFQKISRKSQKSRSAAVSEIFLRFLRFFNLAPRSMPWWAPVSPLCSRTTLPGLSVAYKSFRPPSSHFLVLRLVLTSRFPVFYENLAFGQAWRLPARQNLEAGVAQEKTKIFGWMFFCNSIHA